MIATSHDDPSLNVGQLTTLIVLGGFTAGLDTSPVNVGPTSIARDLHVALSSIQWITSGYLLTLAAALPACPWLQRRFGASRLWLTSFLGFAIASLLYALAPKLPISAQCRSSGRLLDIRLYGFPSCKDHTDRHLPGRLINGGRASWAG
jgi:MFS family permease